MKTPAQPRIFYGWYIVGGAWLAMLVSAAAISSFTVFAPELESQFGWTRVMSSWAYTLNIIIGSAFGILAGILVDRIGLRRMVIFGAIVGGAGTALLSLTDTLWHFYLLFGFIAPAGISLCFMVPMVATVRRWFMRRAAWAVAIAMTGSGMGVVILIPLLQRLIDTIGWQNTYLVLGAIMTAGATIGGAMLRKDPESSGTHPDGVELSLEELMERSDFAVRNKRWSIGDAFRKPAWWLLMLSQFFNMAVIGTMAHIVFWGSQDLGLPRTDVVNYLSYLVLAAVVGRLFGGFFSDWYMSRFKISRKPILYVGTLSVALGSFLAMNVNDATGLLIVSLVIGFGFGIGLAVFPAYLGDLFGVANAPALLGIMLFITAGIFGAIGPILFGFVHDAYGSYDLAFLITAILCVVSAAALVFVRQTLVDRE